MRAVEVVIHNVRSVHDATVRLQDVSLVVGANNAGKSNLVDAIRLFYADLKWDESRDGCKVASADTESWVEIEFEPTADELAQLKDEYRSEQGTFRVRNYLKAGPGPDGKARSGFYAYVDGVLSDTLFYGAKNVGSAKVGSLVYIPAVSKIDDHTKLSGPSSLRELVATVVSKVIATSPAYKALTEAFQTFEGQIKTHKSSDGSSIEALEKEVTGEIASWDSSFNLGIQGIQPEDILKTLIRPQLIDKTHGGEIDQLRFGAGFQRHLVYTLIKLAAKHSSGAVAGAGAVKKEFSPQLNWILFEEPEAFLHPSQEEVLHESLIALAKDDDTQVLLTTHSSRFVSRTMNDLTKVIRLRRDAGITTAFQIGQEELDELFRDALALDDSIVPGALEPDRIDREAAMAALKMELWLQPTRAAAFFAQRVILVEGPSEAGLYAYLTTRNSMPVPAKGIIIVDCMGKYNIHRFMGLLAVFGVDHSVLYDGDNGGSRDTEVSAAITAAASSYTRRVTRFAKDLETELGIPPLERRDSHRKPQYLLYNLEAGLVSDARLTALMGEFQRLATAE